jgi:hypothetical protein
MALWQVRQAAPASVLPYNASWLGCSQNAVCHRRSAEEVKWYNWTAGRLI